MTALGGWLKQIILIVLFAVFAEMLLPTKSMEKYIRMVLGLALIATMLQPLGILVQKDWTSKLVDEAVSELGSAQAQSTVSTDSEQKLADLQNQLTTDRNREANTLLEQRLKNGIKSNFGVQPEDVSVTGSAVAGNLRAHVTMPALQTSRASPIQKWVSSQLGIAKNRVVVDITGGG